MNVEDGLGFTDTDSIVKLRLHYASSAYERYIMQGPVHATLIITMTPVILGQNMMHDIQEKPA